MPNLILNRPKVCPHCQGTNPKPWLEDINGREARWRHTCGWSEEIPWEWPTYWPNLKKKKDRPITWQKRKGGIPKVKRTFVCANCGKLMKGEFPVNRILCGSVKCYRARCNERAKASYRHQYIKRGMVTVLGSTLIPNKIVQEIINHAKKV